MAKIDEKNVKAVNTKLKVRSHQPNTVETSNGTWRKIYERQKSDTIHTVLLSLAKEENVVHTHLSRVKWVAEVDIGSGSS